MLKSTTERNREGAGSVGGCHGSKQGDQERTEMYKEAQRRRPVILFGIREDSKEDAFFCARSCLPSEGFQVAKGRDAFLAEETATA